MSAEIKRTADLTDNDYARAVAIITGDNNASTSYLQRTMQLGYNAAASLIERAEAEGIVSRPNAAGKREVTPAASTIATLTAQLAEARAMAGAAREQTIAALHGPLWRAILQTEDCMNRVCSYRTEAGGCLCGPKIDRIEAHVRALDPDAAAALAAHDKALVERWREVANDSVAALVECKRELWRGANGHWTIEDFRGWAIVRQINAALDKSHNLLNEVKQ